MKAIHTGHTPAGHYSSGMEHNGTLYISGQLSIDPATGKRPDGDINEETLQALNNVEAVLKAAGMEKTDVIQCRIYTSSGAYWGDINKVYADFFGNHKPARAIVPCGELHYGCLVEIEAVAVRS